MSASEIGGEACNLRSERFVNVLWEGNGMSIPELECDRLFNLPCSVEDLETCSAEAHSEEKSESKSKRSADGCMDTELLC